MAAPKLTSVIRLGLPRNSLTAFALLCFCLLLLVLIYNGGLFATFEMNSRGFRSGNEPSLDHLVVGLHEIGPGCVDECHPPAPVVMNASASHLLHQKRGYHLLDAPVPHYLPNYKSPCWLLETTANRTQLHCLPYFFMAGWPKCGTTDIYAKLQAHPQVLPGKKELHWWTTALLVHDENLFDYMELLEEPQQAMEKKCSVAEPCKYVIGDGSPSTLYRNDYWQSLPANRGLDGPSVLVAHLLYHFLPSAKFILSARDPVERLFSNFYFQGGKTPSEFDRVARLAVRLFEGCLKKHSVRWCAYWNKHDMTTKTARIRYGLYTVFLEDYLTVYPRENFHILTYDDYSRNNTAELIKMFKFLELEQPGAEYYQKISKFDIANASPRKKLPMLNRTRLFLQQFYKPFNDKLLTRLSLPLDYWGY